MKNPFRTLLKATRRARSRPLAAALSMQRLALALTPARKTVAKAKTAKTKPAQRPGRPLRPAPGTFTEGRFSGAQGRLAYKLYVPSGSTRRRLPLLVMLHGCGQTADEFAAGTGMNGLADEFGFLVLYPQQATSANLGRCWNWHRPGDQQRGGGEPALIAALTRHVLTLCKGNPARTYIAGISAGGAAAAIAAAAYPELYVAAGVHSGLTRGTVTTLRGALAAMRGEPRAEGAGTSRPVPTIVFHGDRDKVVHPANAAGFLAELRRTCPALATRSETGRIDGGRDFTRTVHRQGTGAILLEEWIVHGGGHAWSGGRAGASHTDPAGPDASRAMAAFFLSRRRAAAADPRRRAGAGP